MDPIKEIRAIIDAQTEADRTAAMQILNDYYEHGRTLRFAYLAFR
jgi:hypothetical protein